METVVQEGRWVSKEWRRSSKKRDGSLKNGDGRPRKDGLLRRETVVQEGRWVASKRDGCPRREKSPIMYFASKQKLQYNLLESAIHQFARQFLMIRGNYNGIIVETRRISRPTHYPVMHRL